MRLLVFSDIHSDLRALDRLLDIEADYYIAAGDMVSWARSLDKVGERLARRRALDWWTPGARVLATTLRYQACDNTTCFFPQTDAVVIPVRVLPLTKTPTAVQRKR